MKNVWETEKLERRPVERLKHRWKDHILKNVDKLNLTEDNGGDQKLWWHRIDEAYKPILMTTEFLLAKTVRPGFKPSYL